MKILLIDRDALTTQALRQKLEAKGHIVVEESVKNNAIDRLGREEFDVIFFDPAPLNNARPVILGIRRSVRNYPYIVMVSQDIDQTEALKSGANDIMDKPVDPSAIDTILDNAVRLTTLIKRIGDDSEDFPSAGGVIAKSAFNQLFLSAIDRADRYGEQSCLVFIGIENYKDILNLDGRYAADYAAARLSQYLVRLRRQSDIIAQTGKSEYCLMLQRPMYETEPVDAANRFAEALKKLDDICASELVRVTVYVRLIAVPAGSQIIEHLVEHCKNPQMA